MKSKVLTFIGHKYAPRDVKEIATLVRADLKAAAYQFFPPDTKFYVKIARFAGMNGRSITVTVKSKYFVSEERKSYCQGVARYILKAYQHQESDPMTDYHSTNFFEHVELTAR